MDDPALVDFVFCNVQTQRGGVVDVDVIFSAFEALARLEISPWIIFDQFERNILNSLFNQQKLFASPASFLEHVDATLRFIFWHNIYKFHADYGTSTTDECGKLYKGVASKLRTLILHAPERFSRIIDKEHINAQPAPLKDIDYHQDLEIGKYIVNKINDAINAAQARLLKQV
jgi:hypothetical protein